MVYDDPKNLFVAKFLGTPPINVFTGKVENEKIWIGSDCILDAKGAEDQEVYVAIRPEGFVLPEEECECKKEEELEENRGILHCALQAVEVMGRDCSVVMTHPLSEGAVLRGIIPSDAKVDTKQKQIGFELKKSKVFIFRKDTEERIYTK